MDQIFVESTYSLPHSSQLQGSLLYYEEFVYKCILIKFTKQYLNHAFFFQDYSFLLLGDFSRKETLNTMKLMQFMEFLNLLLDQHVHSARHFLNLPVPRITPMSSCNVLIPHQDALVLYQDIYEMVLFTFESHLLFLILLAVNLCANLEINEILFL